MSRVLKWVTLGLVLLLVIAFIALFFIQEPFRAFAERQLNAHVQGYSFKIGKARLYPNFSLDIENLVMTQTAHPDPPVAQIPKWHFSVQWRHLFSGRLVSDYLIDRPTLHITLPQAKKEVKDEVPIHQKGWRDAVYSFYPFKINEFKVHDAEVTYIDQDPAKPLRLHHLNFRAGNIRNIHFKDNTYPSDIDVDAVVFESGKIRLDGHANFLADPHFAFNADIVLDHVVLDYFLPVTARYNFQLRQGVLSAAGHMEYAADDTKVANLKTLVIEGARVDYVHAPETVESEKQVAQVTAKAAKALHNKPNTLVKIEKATIRNSEFGFVNEAASPPYRVFLTNGEMGLNNISNQFMEGSGSLTLKGKFMGSGDTVLTGTFRPETKSPDFDVNLRIENAQMRSMNNLLRAYGNFDVVAGTFSFYSQLSVKDGSIDGYLKPLFKDMKVYDQRQDADKTLFHKMYEGLIGGIAKLLENPQHEIVATKAEISGKVDNPKTSTWQVIGNLIRNAFFKAILPGFEKEIRRPPQKTAPA